MLKEAIYIYTRERGNFEKLNNILKKVTYVIIVFKTFFMFSMVLRVY